MKVLVVLSADNAPDEKRREGECFFILRKELGVGVGSQFLEKWWDL